MLLVCGLYLLIREGRDTVLQLAQRIRVYWAEQVGANAQGLADLNEGRTLVVGVGRKRVGGR